MFAKVWVLVLLACAQTQGAELYLPSSYVVPGGEGSGAWGEWRTVSSCSRTCGGGVASQKRICLEVGPDGRPACTGGDTKYFSCQTQDCPEGSVDFRQEQCSKHNHEDFKGSRYTWKSYTKSVNPCELTCKPDGQRFYYRFSEKVIDGTRCNEESYDVCVDGVCQPVGCDLMLGSGAREDKCLECRGNNTNCRTYEGQIAPETELRQGYNDVLLIPAGATSIYIEEVKDSNNYLALRSKINNKYYLNGDYMIDFSGTLTIAGASWHYERTQQGFASPDKLRCQGPTNEPLYLSLLLQEDNVGIKYEYSLPTSVAPPPNQQYIWVHDDYTPCSATCDGGFQIRTVTCRSHEELKTVDDSLCDDGLKPVSNQTCNTESCSARWVEGPWSACSKPCGEGGSRSRTVHCEKNIDRYPAIVDDRECFELLGPKPALFQECSNNASYSKWFTGPWKPCDKLCGDGKKTRQVVCYQKDEKGRIEKLSDENCADEKPPTDEPCELHPCDGVDWITSDWSGCDSCTSRVRTRNALCATEDRVVNDTLCGQRPRPVLEEPCDQTKLPACGALWYATQWSECSAECGRGVHTREVFCGLFDGSSIMKVDDARCKKEHKYSDTKPCEIPIEKCPAKWFTSPWGMCDMMCDGGYQARKTMCIVGTKVTAAACDLTTVPELVQPCNTFSCDKDEISTTIKNDEHEEYDDSRRHTLSCHHSGFGCCPDNKTAAMGPFQKGCLIPKTCNETVYGCCPDGVSPATGPKSEGCPSIPCSETMFGCFMADNETSAEVNDRESGPSPPPPCKSSKYGCCKDGQTQSTGPGTESALGAQMEGCVMSCNDSAYGCCPDGETPAHGEQNEGCCLQSPFGCCPDNYTPAEGPLMEGCGCQFAHYGCCPDNVTIARGPNNDGCGCQYTQFGCCPDRHTEASGPDYEGCDCHTYQFGCCPDGSTIAKDPHLYGCHCQQSKYGCCGDKQTAATGPNQAGCDCSTSEYGCCPDGETEAKGKKFLGCTDLPENRQDPVETAARISGDMNDTVIGELDKSLTIRCLAYGYPEPAIFWYRGISGPMVPYSSSLYEARGNVLQIRRLTPETVGEYACQAYNGIDKAATWTITVQAYSSDGHESGPYIVARNREVVVTPRQPQTQPATMPPEIDVPVYQGFNVPEKCTDNALFADCKIIVRSKFCTHLYYSKFCCKSCVEAGQLDPASLDLQAMDLRQKK